jgi:hypothetical protein
MGVWVSVVVAYTAVVSLFEASRAILTVSRQRSSLAHFVGGLGVALAGLVCLMGELTEFMTII